MKHKVKFINLEEDDKDLIVSFALDDPEMGVKSLILLRTLFFEEVLDEKERGNFSLPIPTTPRHAGPHRAFHKQIASQ
ncbi:MAG: hypothetical protein SRB1_02840 [Desulfobacteraceae bacterium Eth-SRB1]|nr:MAG: hypothetical protein SRB1_02840 [Desulfobacteraceae bacterium Eth-SRB1]